MRREWRLHVLPPVGAACAGRTKPPGDTQSGREIHGVLRKRAFPAEGDCRPSVSAFPGAGERGAGGSGASPAHRRASEANLKVERLAQPISRPEHQRAARRDGAEQGESGASPAHRRVSEANLKVERFGEKAEWPFRKISRPKHRNVPKGHYGAQAEGERSEPGGRAFWRKGHSVA